MSRYHGSKICGSQQQAVFCNGDGEQQKAIHTYIHTLLARPHGAFQSQFYITKL